MIDGLSMLMIGKAWQKTLWSLSAQKRAVARWWSVMNDSERRLLALRGASISVCAVAVVAAMPAISSSHQSRLEAADARDAAAMFASLRDGGEAARQLSDASALLQHPWIVRLESSFGREGQPALGRYAAHDRDAAALKSVISFQPQHLDAADRMRSEHHCMAQAVYYEARSESLSGQLAVAEVIANRVRDHRYPNSVCEVVYQGATRTTGCQFTFTCDGATAIRPRGKRWEQASAVAAQVIMGINETRTGEATHYHASYVDPVWNSGLVRTEKIGTHIFYRFPQGAEWALARASLAERRAREQRARIQTVSAGHERTGKRDLDVLKTAAYSDTAAP